MKISLRISGGRVLIGLCASESYRSMIKPKAFCWLHSMLMGEGTKEGTRGGDAIAGGGGEEDKGMVLWDRKGVSVEPHVGL
jgi:hypothetical protein